MEGLDRAPGDEVWKWRMKNGFTVVTKDDVFTERNKFQKMPDKREVNVKQMMQLTHFDEQGASRMVDVGNKEIIDRIAVAHAKIIMKPETFQLIIDKKMQKGDVLEVARIAGIMGAKQTFTLIPMCHPLNLTSVKIDYTNNSMNEIDIFSEVRVTGKTGVEMEAITAAAICAITIYDMCKSVDKGIVISDIHLVKKSGGKSGTFVFGKDSA